VGQQDGGSIPPASKFERTCDLSQVLFFVTYSVFQGFCCGWEKWPDAVVLRLHLKGLENFSVTNGKIKLEVSVSSSEIMRHPGWFLVIIGLLIIGIGVVWLTAPSIPLLGKLPGDIRIERENFRFYFPLTTCILLSLLLTGIMWLVRYFSQ